MGLRKVGDKVISPRFWGPKFIAKSPCPRLAAALSPSWDRIFISDKIFISSTKRDLSIPQLFSKIPAEPRVLPRREYRIPTLYWFFGIWINIIKICRVRSGIGWPSPNPFQYLQWVWLNQDPTLGEGFGSVRFSASEKLFSIAILGDRDRISKACESSVLEINSVSFGMIVIA